MQPTPHALLHGCLSPPHIEVGFFDSYRKEVNMLKINILATCSKCNGDAYLPMDEVEDCTRKRWV
jgi:hypothetical protein